MGRNYYFPNGACSGVALAELKWKMTHCLTGRELLLCQQGATTFPIVFVTKGLNLFRSKVLNCCLLLLPK